MKKIVVLASAAYLLTSVSAYAGIIIQPTIVTSAPAPVLVEPMAPAYVEPAYPQHTDRNHHNYDWKYWHDHRDHDDHDDHDHR